LLPFPCVQRIWTFHISFRTFCLALLVYIESAASYLTHTFMNFCSIRSFSFFSYSRTDRIPLHFYICYTDTLYLVLYYADKYACKAQSKVNLRNICYLSLGISSILATKPHFRGDLKI
jgi:hypothetical protein